MRNTRRRRDAKMLFSKIRRFVDGNILLFRKGRDDDRIPIGQFHWRACVNMQ